MVSRWGVYIIGLLTLPACKMAGGGNCRWWSCLTSPTSGRSRSSPSPSTSSLSSSSSSSHRDLLIASSFLSNSIISLLPSLSTAISPPEWPLCCCCRCCCCCCCSWCCWCMLGVGGSSSNLFPSPSPPAAAAAAATMVARRRISSPIRLFGDNIISGIWGKHENYIFWRHVLYNSNIFLHPF